MTSDCCHHCDTPNMPSHLTCPLNRPHPCHQVSPHDCTGCELCVHACPDAALVSTPIKEALPIESTNWDFFKTLPNR